MTIDKKLSVGVNACSLLEARDREGYYRLLRIIPMTPYLAKIMKDKMGADFLIQDGYNLSDAEEESGSN